MSDTSLNSVSSETSTSSESSTSSLEESSPRRDSRPTLVYTKDFLLNLQFSPSSLVKPDKLPDLGIICDQVNKKEFSCLGDEVLSSLF